MNSADFDGIVVIQCAGKKQPDAGTFMQNGLPVKFVANPDLARQSAKGKPGCIYARPDCKSDCGLSWRDKLLHYNEHYKETGENPLKLLKAWKLYRNRTYGDLAQAFGSERLYILSAGWGLISADFLLPDYDITFSSVKNKRWVKRGRRDPFADILQVSNETKVPIVCFGGEKYVWQFCKLTQDIKCRKIVFYYSAHSSRAAKNLHVPGCERQSFTPANPKNSRTWYYECANQFIDGRITI